MKTHNFLPQTVKEIYDYILDNFKFENNTISCYYMENVLTVINDINNVVNITEAENAKTWAVDSVIFYYIKRKENFAFLAEMLECGLDEGRTKIYELLQNRTSPVIKNNQNIFSVLGKPLPPDTTGLNNFYWYNLSLMYEYFFSKSNGCPFSMYCTEKNRCEKIEKPYSNNDKKCIFDQFSRITGLYKKNIIT